MIVAFIGGGNMAHAMLGGMRESGMPTTAMHVLEPDAAKGAELERAFGVVAHISAGEWLRGADVVVLAVKPQQAHDAVAAAARVHGRAGGRLDRCRGPRQRRWRAGSAMNASSGRCRIRLR